MASYLLATEDAPMGWPQAFVVVAFIFALAYLLARWF